MRTSVIKVMFPALLAVIVGCEDKVFTPTKPPPEPFVVIERPEDTGGTQAYPAVVIFRWRTGGNPPAAEIRHLWSLVVDTNGVYNPGFDIIGDLNENPWRYTDRWSRWIPVDAPGDSGISTVIGDDEELRLNRFYIFAVQARDRRGTVTTSFERPGNIRQFVVRPPSGPLLTISEPLLGGSLFIGTALNPERRDLPPGIPLKFRWRADASGYGGEIAGFRYGWDIEDPTSWDTSYRPETTGSLEVRFFSGTHMLSVEAIDQAGIISRGRYEVTIVPWPMERELLWVDDFYSTEFTQVNWSHPTESQHDEFWTDICSRAAGFDVQRDIFDCDDYGLQLPAMQRVGNYKNIVWTYSSSNDSWSDVVLFTPESQIGQVGDDTVNYLSIFLMKGGHLWTLGRSERQSGLAAALPLAARIYPVRIECEITGIRDDCEGDRSGVFSMPYRDYCVSVIDKVLGAFRPDDNMPERILDRYDVLVDAYRDQWDPITAARAGLPDRLELWEEVTEPGRYFDPDSAAAGPGGLTYVEVYNPDYWMAWKAVPKQLCFHPLYRMRAASDQSVLNDCTIAIWLTKYQDVVPDVRMGAAVAAPSIHFGFPLWFFKRSQVDSIVGVVFEEWGLVTD